MNPGRIGRVVILHEHDLPVGLGRPQLGLQPFVLRRVGRVVRNLWVGRFVQMEIRIVARVVGSSIAGVDRDQRHRTEIGAMVAASVIGISPRRHFNARLPIVGDFKVGPILVGRRLGRRSTVVTQLVWPTVVFVVPKGRNDRHVAGQRSALTRIMSPEFIPVALLTATLDEIAHHRNQRGQPLGLRIGGPRLNDGQILRVTDRLRRDILPVHPSGARTGSQRCSPFRFLFHRFRLCFAVAIHEQANPLAGRQTRSGCRSDGCAKRTAQRTLTVRDLVIVCGIRPQSLDAHRMQIRPTTVAISRRFGSLIIERFRLHGCRRIGPAVNHNRSGLIRFTQPSNGDFVAGRILQIRPDTKSVGPAGCRQGHAQPQHHDPTDKTTA